MPTMYCGKCGSEMRMIDCKTGNGKQLILYRCDNCGNERDIDTDIAKLILFKNRLLNPKNQSHDAFVYRAIWRNKELSTIGLMGICLEAGITNGSREARKLKEIGLLINYKPLGKRYVIWGVKDLGWELE